LNAGHKTAIWVIVRGGLMRRTGFIIRFIDDQKGFGAKTCSIFKYSRIFYSLNYQKMGWVDNAC
jgi:hypothetical protein